jgi:Mn-dependent DtxR family transcriptional regulator
MEALDFLRLVEKMLKKMSDCDLRIDDYKHIEMYEEYARMRQNGEKVDYILRFLSDKHKLSESTIKRIVRRLSKKVN